MQHKDGITYVGFLMLLCLPTHLYTHMFRGELKCLKAHFVDFKIFILKSRKNTKYEVDPSVIDETFVSNVSFYLTLCFTS